MKKVLYVLAVAFILIQFFQIDKTNPAVNKSADFLTIKKTPEPMAQHIRNSCYDCHSNETKYPWYASIQPTAWFLKKHIDEGRRELNFSTFAAYEPGKQAHKLMEAAELVEHGAMPLESYLLIHGEAQLNDTQKKEMAEYFKKLETETRTANHLPAEPAKPKGSR